MTTHVMMNVIGLSLDLIGVILLFFYGIAPLIDVKGITYRSTGEIDIDEVKKAKKYTICSRFGLGMIILGFAFQLIGNLIP